MMEATGRRRLGSQERKRSSWHAIFARDGAHWPAPQEAVMANVTRGGGDFGGGTLPPMPNIRLAGSRILQLGIVLVVILLLLWSTTSIPTGNVGVLTLFGRV